MKDKQTLIGKRGSIAFRGLEIDVLIKEHRHSYGKDRYLVEPISGSGQTVVELKNIKIKE